MAGKQIEIKAISRNTGKHSSRALRRERLVPAIGYGPKTENFNFAITENDVARYANSKYENEIFKLVSDDSSINGKLVLKKDMTVHPVSRRPVHLDFFVPDMTQKVKVEVEINFEGTPKGTKEGGIFNILMRKVEVECLPTEIPDTVTVDVSDLGLNEVLHVAKIDLGSDKIKMITSEEETLATVAAAKEEKATPEGEGDAAAAADAKPEDKK